MNYFRIKVYKRMNKEFIKELTIDIIVDIIAGAFMGIGTYCFAAAFKFPMVGFTNW